MSGKLRLDQIQNINGTGGLYFNPTTNNIELQTAEFNLSFDNINIVPKNKTRITFSMSLTDQLWIVPLNISYIYAKLWGSGGGGGHYGGWSQGSFGGAGGFTRGIIPVIAGESLTIRVPRGGFANPGATNAPFGGGSSTAGGDNQYAGGGGGYCGIFRGSIPLMIAGGGGGGGSISGDANYCSGGAGGGLRGMRGESGRGFTSFAGGGGSQTVGGNAGNGGNTVGGVGSYLQGGSVQGNVYGGGGGGGYYGGGSGSYGNGNVMAGGGGGSGYLHSSVIYGGTFPGFGSYAPATEDSDYPDSSSSVYSSVGFGGNQHGNGGDGFMVIYY